MGQVVSTSVGHKQISGVGGQVDFVRGATMSKNGRSIMAMPSTAAKGAVSKIVSIIDEGAAVTTSRYDVQYVVTEYGIADLRGITLRERAVRLIRICLLYTSQAGYDGFADGGNRRRQGQDRIVYL